MVFNPLIYIMLILVGGVGALLIGRALIDHHYRRKEEFTESLQVKLMKGSENAKGK